MGPYAARRPMRETAREDEGQNGFRPRIPERDQRESTLPEMKDQGAGLGRWLLAIPVVVVVLLGSGQAGVWSARIPAEADTRSKLQADYQP